MGVQHVDPTAEPSVVRWASHVGYPFLLLQVLLWPNGVPVTSGTGAPVALNPEGLPFMGPGGMPCCLGPDGDTLLTWDGRALLGPEVRLELMGRQKISACIQAHFHTCVSSTVCATHVRTSCVCDLVQHSTCQPGPLATQQRRASSLMQLRQLWQSPVPLGGQVCRLHPTQLS